MPLFDLPLDQLERYAPVVDEPDDFALLHLYRHSVHDFASAVCLREIRCLENVHGLFFAQETIGGPALYTVHEQPIIVREPGQFSPFRPARARCWRSREWA